ncbi:MAG: EAL domain-containing protein [Pseudomonadota bacterium]
MRDERMLHDFAEIASDWFWETDAQHRFTFFSNRISEVVGVPAEVFLGKCRAELPLGFDDTALWSDHVADLEARRPFRDFTYQARRPTDNSVFWVRTSGQPVFSQNGLFLGYRGTGLDVTVEVLARTQLEQSNVELKERNAELLKAKRTIERMAYEDPLTGLKNRRFIEEELARLAGKPDLSFAVLHADLDRFKQINDTLGHAAGDEVLCVVAKRLQVCFPSHSTIGRMGGDEFIVLAASPDPKLLLEQANAAICDISQTIMLDETSVEPGASFGIAFREGPRESVHQLLSRADLALYEAKALGRNRAQVFTPDLHSRLTQEKALANDLQLGVKNGEVEVWYQPQIDAQSGELSGAEALMRWNCPKRGVVTPDQFMPTAESLGLMHEIDGLVLRKALDFANQMAKDGNVLPRLSINVSSDRLTEGRIVEEVQSLWCDRRTQLSFELVETVTFDGTMSEIIKHNLDRLREIGVSLEVDDFGTGHASITALLQVEPDFLKIDRSLVSKVLVDLKCRRLVTHVVGMAEVMNIGVIAEGVETEKQAQCLAELGCHKLQGFHFATPMPAADFAGYVIKHQKPEPRIVNG